MLEKPNNLQISDIAQVNNHSFAIKWTTGETQIFEVAEIRKKCPCAVCIDEWTRKPLLDPETVKEDIRPYSISSVGRYALSIHFNDGHKTGIYTFDYLYQIAKSNKH